jgi:hypothetical protein
MDEIGSLVGHEFPWDLGGSTSMTPALSRAASNKALSERMCVKCSFDVRGVSENKNEVALNLPIDTEFDVLSFQAT